MNAVMDWIRARGRLPKENTKATDAEGRAECKVAKQGCMIRDSLPEEEKEELATILGNEFGAPEELVQEAHPLVGAAAVDNLSVAGVSCITANRSTDLLGVIKQVGTNTRKMEMLRRSPTARS